MSIISKWNLVALQATDKQNRGAGGGGGERAAKRDHKNNNRGSSSKKRERNNSERDRRRDKGRREAQAKERSDNKRNAERIAKERGDRQRKEKADKERADRDRRDRDRREKERKEKAERDRREAERKEAARKEAERKEAERKEAERKAAERREAERKEAERQEAERKRKEAERKEAERVERARKERARAEAERKERERAERERAAQAERERLERERVDKVNKENVAGNNPLTSKEVGGNAGDIPARNFAEGTGGNPGKPSTSFGEDDDDDRNDENKYKAGNETGETYAGNGLNADGSVIGGKPISESGRTEQQIHLDNAAIDPTDPQRQLQAAINERELAELKGETTENSNPQRQHYAEQMAKIQEEPDGFMDYVTNPLDTITDALGIDNSVLDSIEQAVNNPWDAVYHYTDDEEDKHQVVDYVNSFINPQTWEGMGHQDLGHQVATVGGHVTNAIAPALGMYAGYQVATAGLGTLPTLVGILQTVSSAATLVGQYNDFMHNQYGDSPMKLDFGSSTGITPDLLFGGSSDRVPTTGFTAVDEKQTETTDGVASGHIVSIGGRGVDGYTQNLFNRYASRTAQTDDEKLDSFLRHMKETNDVASTLTI